MTELTLSAEEIKGMTGYARPALQLRVLQSLGIPARKRPDNSILVMRMHCIHPATLVQQAPQLKSSRK